MSQRLELVFDNFALGLNNRDANSTLQDAESPDMENIVLGKRGAIESRLGMTKFRKAPVSGSATNEDLFLYYEGREYAEFLEGYSAGEGSVSKEADRLLLRASGLEGCGSWVTAQPINFDDIDEIFVELEQTVDVDGVVYFQTIDLLPGGYYDTYTASTYADNNLNRTKLTLDTSNLSGNHYIRVLARSPLLGTAIETTVYRIGFGDGSEDIYWKDTKPVTSIYEYVPPTGESHFLAFAGDCLRKAIPGGWETLQDGFTEGSYLEFISNPIINKALFVNDADGYFETDGNTSSKVAPYSPTHEEAVEIGYNALGGYTSYAELTTNLSGGNNNIRYVARDAGPDGEEISVSYVDPGEPEQSLSVSVEGKEITVSLATDSTGAVVSTAVNVINAIIGNAAAHALVHIEIKSGETGLGIVTPMEAAHLEGGGTYSETITDPKLIAYHHNRVFLANLSEFPDRVYFCGTDINGNILYNYFPTTNWVRTSNARGEEVTALVPFKGKLYIFTHSSIKVLEGIVPSDFILSDISLTVGAVSGRAVVEAGGYLFFLGPDGVYFFDGESAPKKISQRIPATIRSISRIHRQHAVGIAVHEKFYLSVPESTVNDITLEYDTDVTVPEHIGERYGLSELPWTVHRGFVVNDWLMTKDENIYFASNNGYVYQYGVGYEDDGKEIAAYYTTKGIDLRVPGRLKFFRKIYLDFDYDFSSGFVIVEYKADNASWKRLAEIDLSDEMKNRFWLGVRCRRIAFRLKNVYSGSRFRLFSYTLDVAVRGYQVKALSE